MATYDNAYEILSQVRYGLDEYSSAKLLGTDATGRYQNAYLMKQINGAARWLFSILLKRIPHEFLAESTLTATNSVFTLPWDFGVLKYFKDENGYKVFPIQVQDLKLTNSTGSDRLYYRKGNTLILDKSGESSTYTFYYLKKYREIHSGSASAGGAASITLVSTAKQIADYYNGMLIENVTQDWVDTIDDYTAARVATISETAAASDYYGIVPDIPESFTFLIAARAVLNVRLNFPSTKKRPSAMEIKDFNIMLADALRAFAGSAEDIDLDDIFCDYETMSPGNYGVISY